MKGLGPKGFITLHVFHGVMNDNIKCTPLTSWNKHLTEAYPLRQKAET